jgi:hypothetical protein
VWRAPRLVAGLPSAVGPPTCLRASGIGKYPTRGWLPPAWEGEQTSSAVLGGSDSTRGTIPHSEDGPLVASSCHSGCVQYAVRSPDQWGAYSAMDIGRHPFMTPGLVSRQPGGGPKYHRSNQSALRAMLVRYLTTRRMALRAILPEDHTFRYSHGGADPGRQCHNLFHSMRVLGSSFVPPNPLLRCPGLGDFRVGQRPGPKSRVRYWSITLSYSWFVCCSACGGSCCIPVT